MHQTASEHTVSGLSDAEIIKTPTSQKTSVESLQCTPTSQSR